METGISACGQVLFAGRRGCQVDGRLNPSFQAGPGCRLEGKAVPLVKTIMQDAPPPFCSLLARRPWSEKAADIQL